MDSLTITECCCCRVRNSTQGSELKSTILKRKAGGSSYFVINAVTMKAAHYHHLLILLPQRLLRMIVGASQIEILKLNVLCLVLIRDTQAGFIFGYLHLVSESVSLACPRASSTGYTSSSTPHPRRLDRASVFSCPLFPAKQGAGRPWDLARRLGSWTSPP